MLPIKNHQNTYKNVTPETPKIHICSKSLNMAILAILGLQDVISGLPGQKWLKRHMNLWWNSALKRHYFRTDAEGKKGVKKRGSKKWQKFWRKKAQKSIFLKKAKKHPKWPFLGVFRSPKMANCVRQNGVKRTPKSQHVENDYFGERLKNEGRFYAEFCCALHFWKKLFQILGSFYLPAPLFWRFFRLRPIFQEVPKGAYTCVTATVGWKPEYLKSPKSQNRHWPSYSVF